jgi:exosortase/archaeosortase family protein
VTPRAAFALAGAAALAQVALASRWHDAYLAALAIGWAAALAIAWSLRGALPAGAPRAARWAGLLVAVLALAAMAATADRYRTFHRLVPLATGAGLAVAAAGLRGGARLGRAVAVLGMPLVYPLPTPLVPVFERLPETAAAASWILAALRFPVERAGNLLHVGGEVPGGSGIAVVDGCGGISTLAMVLALALLVACAFRATLAQCALLAASGIAVAFATNAARVAVLAVLASRRPHLFDRFDGHGAAAPLFTAATLAVALLAWRVVLGRRRRPAAGADACPGGAAAR